MAPAESSKHHQELLDRVKQNESKLATLTAINGALQNENDQLRGELEGARGSQTDAGEELVFELREEFAHRLGSADKAIANLKDERDGLRAAAAMASQGGTLSEARLLDREQLVDSLQSEGEALSRRNGELEATVRKLRSAARDADSERERLMARIQTLEAQVHKERDAGARVADEAARAVEDMEAELASVRLTASKQMSEARRVAAAAADSASAATSRGSEEALTVASQRVQDLTCSVQELRAEMEHAAAAGAEREGVLRREAMRAEEKLRATEMAVTDLASSTGDSTKPLLRQIEAMAAAAAGQYVAAEEVEGRLLARAKAAEISCTTAWDAERTARGQVGAMEAAVAAARDAGCATAREAAEARKRCELERRRASAHESERDSLQELLTAARRQEEQQRRELEDAAREWHEQFISAQEVVRSLTAELQSLQDSTAMVARLPGARSAGNGKASTSDSSSAGADALLNCQAHVAGYTREVLAPTLAPASTVRSVLGSTDVIDQMLCTISDGSGPPISSSNRDNVFKQRRESARVSQLQKQVLAAELTRDEANKELLRAASRAVASEAGAQLCAQLQHELKEAKRRLEICLELIGERNERIEQLEDDVGEMKSIFRTQLSLAADQLAAVHQASQL